MSNKVTFTEYRVTFNDLSVSLKIAVIGAYVLSSLFLISFIVGFIGALRG